MQYKPKFKTDDPLDKQQTIKEILLRKKEMHDMKWKVQEYTRQIKEQFVPKVSSRL